MVSSQGNTSSRARRPRAKARNRFIIDARAIYQWVIIMLSEDQVLQWCNEGVIEVSHLLPTELVAAAAEQAAVRALAAPQGRRHVYRPLYI